MKWQLFERFKTVILRLHWRLVKHCYQDEVMLLRSRVIMLSAARTNTGAMYYRAMFHEETPEGHQRALDLAKECLEDEKKHRRAYEDAKARLPKSFFA